MSKRARHIFSLFVIPLLWFGCDTSNNVEPRNESTFVKFYGQEGDQFGADLKATADGGFIMIGTSDPNPFAEGDKDIFVVRTDNLGNLIWSSTFGGDFDDEGVSIQAIANNEYVFGGNHDNGTDQDIIAYKINDQGLVLDSLILGFPGETETLGAISVISDGFIVAGTTTNIVPGKSGSPPRVDTEDIYSVRLDNAFVPSPVWTTRYGFPGFDRGIAILQKTDGDFAYFGTTDKASNDPQLLGSNIFAFPANNNGLVPDAGEPFGTTLNEEAVSVSATSVNSFVVVGTSTDPATLQQDIFLLQLRSDLEFESQGTVNSSLNVVGRAVTEAQDGGFIVLGEETTGGESDIYLAKVTVRNEILWETTFGGDGGDTPGSVIQLQDGSLVLVGSIELETQSKMALIKTSSDGGTGL